MFKLTDAYNSDSASPFATAVLTIGTAVFFSIGLFLILNAHDRSQAKQMQQTVAALRKSQEEGISVNAALAELQNESSAAKKKKSPVVSTFETLSVKGESTLQGNVNTNKDVSVGGKLSVKGETSLTGNLSTKGNATIGGDLGVNGTTSLQIALAVGGDTVAAGGFNVSGMSTLAGDLEVDGEANLAGLTLNGDALFSSALSVSGPANLQGGLEVAGPTSVGSLSVGGETLLDSSLAVQGALVASGGFEVAGATTIGGNLQVAGDTLFDNSGGSTPIALAVQGAALLNGGAEVNGATTVGGALSVQGASSFEGSGLASGTATLAVQGQSTLDGSGLVAVTTHTVVTNGSTTTTTDATQNGLTLSVGGATNLTSTLDVIGATSIDDTLTVAGAVTIDGSGLQLETNPDTSTHNGKALAVSGAATFNNTLAVTGAVVAEDLTVSGAATFSSTLGSTGTVTLGSLNLQGGATVADLDVTGGATLNSTLNVSGGASFGDTVSVAGATSVGSASFDAGGVLNSTLTVAGNMGVDGDLSVQTTVVNGSTVGGALNIAGFFVFNGLNNSSSVNGHAGKDIDGTASDPGGTAGPCSVSQHIRITRVEAGIITGAHCQANSGSGWEYDLAENFPSVQSLSAGDVVSIDPNNAEHVVKSTASGDIAAIGVVSTAPGITLGSEGPGYPIALSGRVPVKVTNEGGAIAPGDYLSSSSTPGYAKKAAAGEKTIGQALESFTGASGTVKMFVNVSKPVEQGVVQVVQAPAQGESFANLNVSGQALISDLQVTGTATINNLQVTGVATVATLKVEGHIIGNDDTRGAVTVPAGQATIHHNFATPYSKAPAVVASPVSQAVLYTVVPTETGFDINLTSPVAADTRFNYLVQE